MYDRKKDPYELNNIYNDENYSEIRGDLHKRLELLRPLKMQMKIVVNTTKYLTM